MKRGSQKWGVLVGLAAAASFGASTPFAKQLVEEVGPQLLAGLLYFGAFLALLVAVPSGRRRRETQLRRSDLPALAGLIVMGGVVAPVLLLVGLERVAGSTGSLLLNLEGPCTVLLGLLVFREHLGRGALVGAAAVFGGAALLSASGPAGSVDAVGVVAIAGACLLWGVDNNLTQSLTVRDPVQVVAVKTGVAGLVNIGLALARGEVVPAIMVVAGALVLGALSYGLSILLDAYALRALGAAREAGIFATAPFVGAALSIPLLSETVSARELVAGAVMAAGIGLIVIERHEHEHLHEPFSHEHLHVHDEHHEHEHASGVFAGEPHAHIHRHGRLVHAHPHVSDVHHRHSHARRPGVGK